MKLLAFDRRCRRDRRLPTASRGRLITVAHQSSQLKLHDTISAVVILAPPGSVVGHPLQFDGQTVDGLCWSTLRQPGDEHALGLFELDRARSEKADR